MIYSDHSKMNEMINEIVRLMPSLNPFFLSGENLESYSRRVNEYHPHRIYLIRQKKFKELILKKINRIFSREEFLNLNIDLSEERGLVAGIVDHHGLLNHPLILSVHLVSNFYKLFQKTEHGDILTFSTGNVPFQNPFNPRGVLFHGKNLHLFPKKYKNKFVFTLPKHDFAFIDFLKESHQWHTLSQDDQKFLSRIQSIIQSLNFDTCQYYEEQISKINLALWPLLFEENLRLGVSKLALIDYDDIVLQYLIHILTNEKESFVYRVLFDDQLRKKVMGSFEGFNGAWDSKRNLGTHFFWGYTDDGKQVRLKIEGRQLIGTNYPFQVNLEPETLIKDMQKRKILPGMVYKFMIILFYMGMKPMAGYSLEYLSRMRNRMIEVMKAEFPEEVLCMKTIPLDNMNLISICKTRTTSGELKDLSAFDIMNSGGMSKDYLQKISKIPFKDFLTPFLPFTYDYALSKYGHGETKKDFQIPLELLQKSFDRVI